MAGTHRGAAVSDAVTALRKEAVPAAASLWEILVQRKLATDDQVLAAIADDSACPSPISPEPILRFKASVPEQLARRFNVVPIRQTDSFLEVATANPFDLDAEKGLAFATAHEVRMLLGSPARIRDKLDELYRDEYAVPRLIEGHGR